MKLLLKAIAVIAAKFTTVGLLKETIAFILIVILTVYLLWVFSSLCTLFAIIMLLVAGLFTRLLLVCLY